MMTTFDPIPLTINPTPEDLKNGEILYRSHAFDLDPIAEVCLRFVLHIDFAPDAITVNMNRWQVGITQIGQPFVADVTDYVTLEDNVMLLNVNQPGSFGAIWLDRVPCEEIK
ncbi:MAG: hypothetical protein ABI690_29960 [Chloroflexota bacterium]